MQKESLQADFNTPKAFTLIFLALAILFFIDGCIPYYIPTPEHGYEDQLKPGTTTKNDVRTLLGAPEEISDNLYCYFWRRTDGYYGVLWLGTNPNLPNKTVTTEDLHAFCLQFMPDDKLKRFKHFESGGGYEAVYPQIEDWENKED